MLQILRAMKFLKSIAIILPLFLFVTACKKDDAPVVDTSEKDNTVGVYSLTELTISPSQDINGDGNSTTDVLSELSCASGTMNLKSDNTYTWNFIGINVTSITGNLYAFSCNSDANNISGFWTVENGIVTLGVEGTPTTFSVNGSSITATINGDLPAFKTTVYTKQ